MCIVIDASVIPKVFGKTDPDYIPVYDWITKGRGKIVIGGTKYGKELANLGRFTRLLSELSRQRKVIVMNKKTIDRLATKLKEIEPKPDFDDPHIVALVEESGCRIVCSEDKRSDKYLRDSRFYKKSRRPSIYRYAKKHTHLISDKNIVGVCC